MPPDLDLNDLDFDDLALDEEFLREEFAEPGGNSALRAATLNNPRIHQCPTCCKPDRLTSKDVALGYQCDDCADVAERGF